MTRRRLATAFKSQRRPIRNPSPKCQARLTAGRINTGPHSPKPCSDMCPSRGAKSFSPLLHPLWLTCREPANLKVGRFESHLSSQNLPLRNKTALWLAQSVSIRPPSYTQFQMEDLAGKQPERVNSLAKKWDAWASANNVTPLPVSYEVNYLRPPVAGSQSR